MQLIMSPASPYVRKVRVLIHETGLEIDEIQVATSPLASAPELLAASPLAKLPTLVREDGPNLFDSRVITRYLDDLAQSGLYPQARLWDVLTLEAIGDGMCDSAVSMAYEGRFRPPEQQSPDWVEAQWAKVARACQVLEAQWMGLLHGPVQMGQIAVACALSYVDFRHGARDWRSAAPELANWHGAFEQRPSMQATRPV